MAGPTDKLRAYSSGAYPQLTEGQAFYISDQFAKIAQAITSTQQIMVKLDVQATPLVDAASDAAAATAGVPINGFYRTAGAVKVRLT